MHPDFYKSYSRDDYRVLKQQFRNLAPQRGSTIPETMRDEQRMQTPTPSEMGQQRRTAPTPPEMPGQRPEMRPSPPSMPDQRPGTRPTQPETPNQRPEMRPSPPGMPGQRPGTRPTQPETPNQRPEMRPTPPGMPGQRPEMRPPVTAPGMEQRPRTAPPDFIPEAPGADRRGLRVPGQGSFRERFAGDFRTHSREFFGCINRFTFIWLINGNRFWFYPTFVDRRFVYGFRWRRDRWVYDRINVNRILFFSCF